MGTPSAIASAIASTSLTGAKIYNLSDVDSVDTQQDYTEVDYSIIDISEEFDEYSVATQKMAKDKSFIFEIAKGIAKELDLINYEKTDIVVENSIIFAPSLIRMCDYSEELQRNKSIEEYSQAVRDRVIEFALKNKELLSSYDLDTDDQPIVVETAMDVLTDLSQGKTFEEIFSEKEQSSTVNLAQSFCKDVFKTFIKSYFSAYGDDMIVASQRFLALFGDDALRLGSSVGSKIVDNTPFLANMFTDVFLGGFDDLLSLGAKAGKFLSKTGLKKIFRGLPFMELVDDVAASFVPAAGARTVPFVVSNLISNVSKTGFKVQGRYVGSVRSFLGSDSLIRKLFVPKDVTTVKQFAEELAKNTCIKSVACKAVGTGVTSLVVGSTVSFAFEFAETLIETKDPIEALKAGGAKIIEDLPKNTSIAVGAAVGQVVGSVSGAAIGGAIGGPVGAFIGEKVGGFLGSIIGGFIGETVYNACSAAEASGKKWYKPWTWF